MMIGWLTNAISVDTPRLGRVIWVHIWTYIVEKSQTNATNVIMHHLRQALFWVHLNAHIGEKSSKCNQCDYAFSYASNLGTHFKNTYCRKVKQMQSMWLCIFYKPFEGTFENTQWRKVKQMQPLWLCILSNRQFEETFENPWWRKDEQM